MQAELLAIADIVGHENVLSDHAARLAYAQSFGRYREILPLACVRLQRPDQIARIYQVCHDGGLQMTFRGGGTSIEYSAAPTSENTVMVLTTNLNRIYEIDEQNRLIRVQPGVVLQHINEAAGKKGLMCVPVPPVPSVATVGGHIATNAVCSRKYGPISNYVQKVDLWAPDGKRIPCDAANFFNAGFPLASLCCGSAGCLGLLGDSVLRLIPIPSIRSWIIARFSLVSQVAVAYDALLKLDVVSLDIFDPQCTQILLGNPQNNWLVAVQMHCNKREEVDEAASGLQKAGGQLCKLPDFDVTVQNILPTLYGQRGPFSTEILSCPPSKMCDAFEELEGISTESKDNVIFFGNAAAGKIHVGLFGEDQPARKEIKNRLFTMELMLNDAFGREWDENMAREEWQRQGTDLTAISAEIRKLFDPAGILASRPLPGGL